MRYVIQMTFLFALSLGCATHAQVPVSGNPLPVTTATDPEPVSPEEAQEYFDALLEEQRAERALAPEAGKSLQLAPQLVTEVAPQIKELARALRYDVDLIFQYVYNNIALEPVFGQKKSALGTLLDKSGNPFDQAFLLAALLREANYEFEFIYGVLRLDSASANAWLGTSGGTGNIGNAFNTLSQGYVPVQFFDIDGVLSIEFFHVWLRVKIGDQFYVFDPSMKAHTVVPGVSDLASAMQYNSNGTCGSDPLVASCGLLTAAGGVENNGLLSGFKDDVIQEKLDIYAANLNNYLNTNHPDADSVDVVGGLRIVTIGHAPVREIQHPNLSPNWIPTNWQQTIPDLYRTSLRFTNGNSCSFSDPLFYSSDIDAKRLTVLSTGTTGANLFLEGVIADSWSGLNGSINLRVCVDHPYANSGSTLLPNWGNGAGDSEYVLALLLKSDAAFAIMNGWGATGRERMSYHQNRLNELSSQGAAPQSEPVIGETLMVTTGNWQLQNSMLLEMFSGLFDYSIVIHNQIGVAGQVDAPYVDIPGVLYGSNTRNGVFPIADLERTIALAGPASAAESTTIEQVTNSPGVSTVTLFDQVNANGHGFFDIDSIFEFYAKEDVLLQNGYSQEMLDQLELAMLRPNAISSAILPEYGDLQAGIWTGYTYIIQQELSGGAAVVGYIIKTAKGAFSRIVQPKTITITNTQKNIGLERVFRNLNFQRVGELFADPVNTFTGGFVHISSDIAVGSQPYPHGLGFERYYDSTSRLSDNRLGLGWNHNFDIRTIEYSDAFQGLGQDSPVDAVPMIVAMYVGSDLVRSSTVAKNVIVATLVQDWGADHLFDNAVTVALAGNNLTFTRLSGNLGYNGPPDSSAKLTRNGTFTLETLPGDVLNFNAAGNIDRWIDANGFAVQYGYGIGDRLETVENDFGWRLQFGYSANGNISSLFDGLGRSVTFGYDTAGNLTSVTNAEGDTTFYAYEAQRPGLMTDMYYPSFPTVSFITNTYDTLGRVKEQTTPQTGLEAPYVYYLAGARAETVDPLGGSQVWYQDEFGKITSSTDPLGRETKSTFDGRQRLIERVFPQGNSLEITYDDATCASRCTHNVSSRTRTADPVRGGAPIIESYDYFGEGKKYKLRRYTDARLNDWVFDYDVSGNLLSSTSPAVPDGVPVTTYTYYPSGDARKGLLRSTVDPTGLETVFDVSPANGNLIEAKIDPTGLALATTTVYDVWGNPRTTTDADGRVTVTYFDCERRLRASVPPDPGAGRTPLPSSRTDYDADGRPVVQRLVRGDVSGVACGASSGGTGTILQSWSTIYQTNGMLSREVDPEGAATKYFYDALDRQIMMTDPDGRSVETTYDAAGQVTQTKAVMGAAETIVANTEYGANGNQTALIDALNNRSEFFYDGHDRLIETRYPSKTVPGTTDPADKELLNYDPTGNVTSRTTRAGQMIAYTYDALNRLTDKTGAVAQDVRYGYDLAGRQVSAVFTSGSAHDIIYSFDSAGRLITVTDQGRTVSYVYDGSGNRTQMTWPDGFAVSYHYDDASRLVAIREGDHATPGTYLASYDYGALSLLASQALGDAGAAGTSTYAYFSDSTLRAATHDLSGDADDVRFEMTYWPSNRLRSMALSNEAYQYQPVAGLSETLTANGLNQLTTASFGGAPANLNYDPSGNLTAEGTAATYGYDAENRLTSAQTGGTTVAFGYDPQDRRSTKTVGGTAVTYLYDGAEIIADLAPDGTVLRRYVYGLGVDEPIAMYVGTSTAQKRFYIADPQGSVIALTDGTGAVQERHSYSPFGRPDTAAIGASGNPLRYASLRWDADIGLYDMRARVYNPQLRRFMQPDPIGYGDGPNIYAYVGNDPVNFSDPSGFLAEGNQEALSSAQGGFAAAGVLALGDGPIPGPADILAAGVAIGVTGKLVYDIVKNESNEDRKLDELRGKAVSSSKKGGKSDIKFLPGGFEDANKDFDDLVDPGTVENKGGGIRVGSLKSGDRVVVRPDSTDGRRPTLEIQRGKKREKFRYGP